MAKAPGKSSRKGITLLQAVKKFEDEEKSRRWFEEQLWPDGPFCPHCGSFNVQSRIKHLSMTHRCRDCSNRPMFSVRVGTVLENTRLPYRTWAIGIYLFTTVTTQVVLRLIRFSVSNRAFCKTQAKFFSGYSLLI